MPLLYLSEHPVYSVYTFQIDKKHLEESQQNNHSKKIEKS